MDCSLPGFSIHGIFQARVLEWGAIGFSKICLPYPKRNKTKTWEEAAIPEITVDQYKIYVAVEHLKCN